MLKIRRPLGRLIFNMGIAIPGKTVFLIETAPWAAPIYLLITTTGTGSLLYEQMSVNIIKMRRLSFKKMYLKVPFVKWQPFVTGLYVLANSTVHSEMHTSKKYYFEFESIAGLLINSLTEYLWNKK